MLTERFTEYLYGLRYWDVLVATVCLNFAFFATCYWIYRNEVSGKWEKYRVRLQGNIEPVDLEKRRQVYKDQVGWVAFYLAVVMPLVFIFPSNYMFAESRNFLVDLLKTLVAFVVTRLWSCFVHIQLHSRLFAKYHKDHHVPMGELTCLANFANSTAEFLMMEAFAWVIGMSAVGGLPTFNCILLAGYIFVNAAMDHSGFCLHPFWYNSIYHYVHHA